MELKDYTYEEIEQEYVRRKKQRFEERQRELAKVKRCRSCKHIGTTNAYGDRKDTPKVIEVYETYFCPFCEYKQPTKRGRCKKVIALSKKACEHYEERQHE